jgi:hypothetical protein
MTTSSGFAASPGLVAAITELTPRGGFALDLGAGALTTANALAACCRRVYSLEENAAFATRARADAASHIDVIHSPLSGGDYRYRYFGPLDAIVVDGPRGDHRGGCLAWVPNLREGGYLFIDDAHRPGSVRLISALRSRGYAEIRQGADGPRQWCVLRKPVKPAVMVDLLMLSYNRSEYTVMTLESLVQVPAGLEWERVRFTVIDHASSDDSVAQIAGVIRKRPTLIDQFIVADRNRGASGGTGWFLQECAPSAPYIGKIDNDSLFTDGWLGKLVAALAAHATLGVVGAQEHVGQGQTAPVVDAAGVGFHPARWVGGRYLARREVFARSAPGGSGVWGWTDYQLKQVAGGGWKIGWCVPDAVIEHVGDWQARHPRALRNEKYASYLRAVRRGH